LSDLEVLFAHAYLLSEDHRPLGFMHPLPPLQPAEIAAWLQQEAGAAVGIWDSTFRTSLAAFEVACSRSRPRMAWIHTHPTTRAAGKELMAIARRTGAVVVAGGPDAGLRPEEYLRGGADAVVPGEGEDATLQLLLVLRAAHHRASPELLDRVPGLHYLDDQGQVRASAGKPRVIDVERLPWPLREEESTRIHLERWRDHRKYRPLALASARGCPVRCGFCTASVFGRPYRRRAPKDVAAEAARLVERFEFDRLVFNDEVFLFDRLWLRELMAELKKGPRVRFEGCAHPGVLPIDLLPELADAGLTRVEIDAASGSSRLLTTLGWSYGPADVYRAVSAVRSAGVNLGLQVTVGLPGETRRDLDATMEMVRVAKPDGVEVTRVDPGSPALFRKDWERVVGGPVAARTERRLPSPVLQTAADWLLLNGGNEPDDPTAGPPSLLSRVRRPLLRAALRVLPGR
jgi:anaerobic magnesium-protoporphyrin IX monomethyl ester cyclase